MYSSRKIERETSLPYTDYNFFLFLKHVTKSQYITVCTKCPFNYLQKKI